MAEASAPGKAILLGEHAVVFGEPALAVALSLRTRVLVAQGQAGVRVNGVPLDPARFPHVEQALRLAGTEQEALAIEVASSIPKASGLGSSAALSAALLAALLNHGGREPEPRELARLSFEAELAAQQGNASPTDTSTSVAGGCVLVDSAPGPGLLWDFERAGRCWFLHRLEVPDLTLVVAPSGERAPTGQMVARVGELVRRDPAAQALVRDLGEAAREGAKALAAGDLPRLGKLMDRAHEGLRRLGVSTPRLDELREAARPHSLGAKLTGAGGGGCVIALSEQPEEAARALRAKGCEPILARLSQAGVEVEP